MVSPLKMPSISLPSLARRKTFGTGQAGTFDSMRATARGESTIMPCAASPPMTFCQEKVTTSSLGPVEGHREGGRGGVADGDAFAVGGDQSPSGTRTPAAVPFQVKMTSLCRVSTAERSGRMP